MTFADARSRHTKKAAVSILAFLSIFYGTKTYAIDKNLSDLGGPADVTDTLANISGFLDPNGPFTLTIDTDHTLTFAEPAGGTFIHHIATATDGTATVTIVDTDNNTAPTADTFSGTIGTEAAKLGHLNIGSAGQAADVTFSAAVNVATLTVSGGDNNAEDSIATFDDTLTATNIILDDDAGSATLLINGTGSQIITGAINGAFDAPEGNLSIIDTDDEAAPNTDTFSDKIGNNVSLLTITIGDGNNAGDASFKSTVNVATLTVSGGDNDAEDSIATFDDTLTATTINIGAGNDGTSATATAKFNRNLVLNGTMTLAANNTSGGDVNVTVGTSVTTGDITGTGAIVLNDSTSGVTSITFMGGVDQTISSTIDGGANGEGSIIVSNTLIQKATFSANIGATASVKTITLGGTQGNTTSFEGTVRTSGGIFVGSDAELSHTSNATFKNTVTSAIIIGEGGGNTNTNNVIFNSATQGFTVTGTISGADVEDTSNIIINGGNTNLITIASDIGDNINNITIGNASAGKASFSGTVSATDTITIGSVDGVSGSSATFKNNVSGAIVLGTGADNADTNTVIFDSGDQNITVSSNISGGDAADTNTLNVTGANTVTFTNVVGDAALDSIAIASVAGTNGSATFNDNVTASSIALGTTGGTETATLTFDTATDRTITGTIASIEAGDTANLVVIRSTDGASGLVTFNNNVGGSSASTQIDALTIGGINKSGNASFAGTFYGNSITITGGDNATENSSATFEGNLTATAIVLNDNVGIATLSITGTAAQTITGTINAATDGEGILTITDGTDTATPDTDTFTGIIGATNKLGTINIGSSTLGGNATFDAAVATSALTITGGNDANEDSTGTFSGDLTTTSITLNDTTSGGIATLTLNGTNDQTIAGAIDGNDIGEGDIWIVNSPGRTATFSGTIGANKAVDAINIGYTNAASSAAFAENVTAGTITITAKTDDTDNVSYGVFKKDVSANIVLNNSNTQSAGILFDGETAQTVTGSISGDSAGEGVIRIGNTDAAGVTFAGNIGAGEHSLNIIQLSGDNVRTTFSGTVSTLSGVVIGDADHTGTATATFKNTLNSAVILGADNIADDVTAIFDGSSGAFSVTGTISGSGTAGTNTVVIAGSTNLVTFNTATGSNIDTITIGNTAAGNALFNAAVTSDTINISGGNADAKDASAQFESTVTANAINVTGGSSGSATASATFNNALTLTGTTLTLTGGTNAGDTASATLTSDVTGGTIVLNDTAAQTTLTVNGSGAQIISATVDGNTDGEGTLIVKDTDNDEAPNADIFSGKIGNTHKLLALTIGNNANEAGSANFADTVQATTISIFGGNNDAEDSLGQFDAAVTATTINITAGNTNIAATATADFNANLALTGTMTLTANNQSGGDALVTVSGNITGAGAIILNEDAGDGVTSLTLDGAAAQTVNATLDGNADNQGTLIITDTDNNLAPDEDTFSAIIGANHALSAIRIGSSTLGGNATFAESVSSNTLVITGGNHADEDSTGTFSADLTTTAITLDDTTSGGIATLTVNGTDDQTIAGAIDGSSNGEGDIWVVNDNGKAATFSGAIGATHAVDAINIGYTNAASSATFAENVTAGTITITAKTDEEDNASIASFLKNVTGDIVLNDSNTVDAGTSFDGTSAQTITGSISGATEGEGTILITNSHASGATFLGTIGAGEGTIRNVLVSGNSATAIFSNTVSTTEGINIGDTDHTGTDSATFKDTVTSTITLGGGDTEDANTALFDSSNGAFSVTGTISGNNTTDTNAIIVAGSANLVTFNTDTGSNIDTITVGNTVAGNAQFNKVTATTITIGGADATVTSAATFTDTVNAAIVLGTGGTSVNTSTATFNAADGAFSVTGTISGGHANDTNAIVIAGSTNLVTFNTATGSNIDTITIGNTAAGNALFNAAVTSGTISVSGGNTDAKDASAQFESTVTATTINVTGGSSGSATASAAFNGALTLTGTTLTLTGGTNTGDTASASIGSDIAGGTIILNDTAAQTTLTVGGATAQSISATFNGNTDGEGTLIITDADNNLAPGEDTFSGIIGGSHKLAAIKIGSSILGGNATFSNNVSATALTITGGDHAAEDSTGTFSANLTTTTVTLDDTASGGIATLTVNGSDDQTIAGTIDGSSNGEGDIWVVNNNGKTATFSGAIGATHALDAVNIGTDTQGSNATFNSHVTADTVTVTSGNEDGDDSNATFKANITAAIVLDDTSDAATSTLTFSGTSAQTVTGSINAATAGEGSVAINNDLTITGALGSTLLKNITIASGKTLTIGQEDATTAFGASTITVQGTLHIVDTLTLTEGSALTFKNGSSISASSLSMLGDHEALLDASTHTASLTIGESSSDEITLTLPESFTTGSFILFDAQDGTYTQNGTITITDNGSTHYTLANTDGLITVTAETEEGSGGGSSGGDSESLGIYVPAQQLKSFSAMQTATEGNSALANRINEILDSGTEQEKAAMYAQSQNAPTASVASTSVIASSTLSSMANIFSHLSAIQTPSVTGMLEAPGSSGIAAGSPITAASNQTMWVKPYYNHIHGYATAADSGYSAETSGVVAGSDLYRDDNTTIGVAFSYGETNVSGKGLSRDDTNIQNYQFSAYGSYHAPSWYMEGIGGYGINNVDSKRHITFVDPALVAAGEYEGKQIMAEGNIGMPVEYSPHRFLTPVAGLQYLHIANQAYTETGAGLLNLQVRPQDMDILQGSLGLRLHSVLKDRNGGTFIPQIHANALFEFIGREAKTTSSYSGGGAAFEVKGNTAEQLGGNAGTSLTYNLNALSVSASYDVELRENYVSHTGTMEVGVKF